MKFDEGTDPATAAALAKRSQVAIVFAVQHASEGMDLKNLSLPHDQDSLIEAVAAANPHTIVVLETGGAVLMPWIDKVAGVVEAWYPGIRGSEAIANVLFGDVNPSGKLPLTFPKSEADLPHPSHVDPPKADSWSTRHRSSRRDFRGQFQWRMVSGPCVRCALRRRAEGGLQVVRRGEEGGAFPLRIWVVVYDLRVFGIVGDSGDSTTVSFRVKNTGRRAGMETAMCTRRCRMRRASRRSGWWGWAKVNLAPGRMKQVSIPVSRDRLSVFDEGSDSWKLVPGEYVFRAGGSSRDLPLQKTTTY